MRLPAQSSYHQCNIVTLSYDCDLANIISNEPLLPAIISNLSELKVAQKHLAKAKDTDIIIYAFPINKDEIQRFFRNLSKTNNLEDITIIAYSSDNRLDTKLDCFSLGFNDFWHDSMDELEIKHRLKVHQDNVVTRSLLKSQTMIDPLTGIGNRQKYTELLGIFWNLCLWKSEAISLLLIDIDNFKLINELFGYRKGDKLLKELTDLILPFVSRSKDCFCRIGDDEFSVILPSCNAYMAQKLGKSIVTSVAKYTSEDLMIVDEAIALSVSIGGATVYPKHNEPLSELFDLADQALYDAKSAGKGLYFGRSAQQTQLRPINTNLINIADFR